MSKVLFTSPTKIDKIANECRCSVCGWKRNVDMNKCFCYITISDNLSTHANFQAGSCCSCSVTPSFSSFVMHCCKGYYKNDKG